MEVSSFSSDVMGKAMMCSMVKAVVAETLLAAQRSLVCLLLLTGSLLKDVDDLPALFTDKGFPMDELHKKTMPEPENKDAGDSEDDDEDDDDDDDQDDDAGDEDFSGEEGGEDDEDAEPEKDPETNGNGGSGDEDDDDDGDEDDDEDEDEDDEEEEDEDEEDQPPAKKRK